MTGQPDVAILAHHGLLLAIPAFAPAVAVAGVVIYVALRDRRNAADVNHSDGARGEISDSPRQDGSP